MTTVIDRDLALRLSAQAEDVLRKHFNAQGFTLLREPCKYSSSELSLRMKLVPDGADPDREEFVRSGHWLGLAPEDFGRTVRIGGLDYTLVGVNLRRPKFPIIGARNDNRYKLTEAAVRKALGCDNAP